MLKNSVLASLDQAIGAFKHSKGRLKKLRKDFIDFDKQETANLAIAQLSDMISGKFKNKIMIKMKIFSQIIVKF